MPRGNPSEAEWAWMAGLFEGEGCISFRHSTSVAVVISMTDLDVLETVNSFFPAPGGIKPRQGGPKPAYVWWVSARDDTTRFLEGILPWLHGRRSAKAHAALGRLARCRGNLASVTHCKHGHPLSGGNVYLRGGKHRVCRTCMRAAQKRYRERIAHASR